MARTLGHARSTQSSPTPTVPRSPTPTTTGTSPHTTPDQGRSQSLNPEVDSGGWAEVAVWEDGGQSLASVRSDEWGTGSKKNHTELRQLRQRKRLVCRGNIASRAFLSRSASCRDGCKAAADPSRVAIQFALTTRRRKAILWPKLAASNLYNLQLSRLFHLPRTRCYC